MRKTPLHDEHLSLGAKMVWFAGWDMPVQYTSIIDEHMAVRKSSGAFDISHMGEFIIRGRNAGMLVNSLNANDVASAPAGRCLYSHLLDNGGRILDDTIISVLAEDEYFMVPNAATTQKMRKWIESHLAGQELVDISSDIAAMAVQGPVAKEVVARLTSADLISIRPFWSAFVRLDKMNGDGAQATSPLLKGRTPVNGIGEGVHAFVSRTGYTGEDGFEIFCENADAVLVWRTILERGSELGLKPAGLGARDTLRLEKGLLLSGTDFDGSQTTLQTGPQWVIDWNHEFVGKDALAKQKEAGGYPRLACMIASGKGIPRHGHEIISDGVKIGEVTSGTMSPVMRKGIAMGYVPFERTSVGTRVQIKVREHLVDAEVVKPPFVKRG